MANESIKQGEKVIAVLKRQSGTKKVISKDKPNIIEAVIQKLRGEN